MVQNNRHYSRADTLKQASSKPAQTNRSGIADLALSQAQQEQRDLRAREKLLTSPYLTAENGVLKVIKPASSAGFTDPGMFAAQEAQEMIKTAPYLHLKDQMDHSLPEKVQMTEEEKINPYGNKTFSDIQGQIEANNTLMGSIYANSEFLTATKAENDKLYNYGLSIATDADLNKLVEENNKQLDDLYSHYDSWDISPENIRTFEEMTKLNEQNTLYQSMAYEYSVRHKLAALPEDLQQALLQIPNLEDDKIDINSQYAFGSEQAVSSYPAIEKINTQIKAAKKYMRDLGYTDKEINSLIRYAGRLHDREQYEKRVAEKEAYAKEHPVGASIGSVFENLLGFMDPIDTLQQRIRNLVTAENVPINAYSTAKQITGEVNAARDTIASVIEDSTGSTFLSGLYKGGMTAADILAQAGITSIASGGSSAFAKTAGIKGEELLKKLTALWKTELKNTGIDDVGKLVAGNTKATIDDAANLLADETLKKLDGMNFIDESTLSKGVSNESVINQMVDDWNGTGSQLADNVNEVYNGKSFTEGAGDVGKIITEVKYTPSSGAILKANPNKTTTVLGSFDKDMKNIVNEMGNVKSTYFGAKQGGFNVLNVPDDMYKDADQFWNEINKPWLDEAIKRGDDIVLATKPEGKYLYRFNTKTHKSEISGFGREYNYLRKNGYIYDDATNTMIRR